MKRTSSTSVIAYVASVLILAGVLFQISPTQAFSVALLKEKRKVNTVKDPSTVKRTFTCGDPILDRDGYTYGTVQIGTQCWLDSNLKTKTKPDSTPLTTFSNGSERDCSNTMGVHGTETDCDAGNAIYTWDAAMNGSTTAGDQGLCMTGWHVPTDAEWYTLETFLKSPSQSCNASRVNSFDCADAGSDLLPNGPANFNASLSGLRYTDGMFGDTFVDFEYGGYFWSSTLNGSDVYARNVNTDENRVWRGPIDVSNGNPHMSLAVRCLKD